MPLVETTSSEERQEDAGKLLSNGVRDSALLPECKGLRVES